MMTAKPYMKCTIETSDGETSEKHETGYLDAEIHELPSVVSSVLAKCDFHWTVTDIQMLIEEIAIKSHCELMPELWEQVTAVAIKRKSGE